MCKEKMSIIFDNLVDNELKEKQYKNITLKQMDELAMSLLREIGIKNEYLEPYNEVQFINVILFENYVRRIGGDEGSEIFACIYYDIIERNKNIEDIVVRVSYSEIVY